MYERNSTIWFKHIDFYIIDLIMMNFAYVIGFYARFVNKGLVYRNDTYGSLAILLSLSLVLAIALTSNLKGVLKRGYLIELVRVAILTIVWLALDALIMYSLHNSNQISRLVLLYTACCFFCLDYFARVFWKVIVKKYKIFTIRDDKRKVFIVADHEEADSLINDINEEDTTIEIVKVQEPSNLIGAADFICKEWIDEVFISVKNTTSEIEQFINQCTEMGVTLHFIEDIRTTNANKQFVESIGSHTMMTIAYSTVTSQQLLIKRIGDILGGLVGCLCAIVIAIIMGPIIYLQSPGPIIFKQTRVGKNGRQFKMYKFRSMYLDADLHKKDYLSSNNVADGMMFKMDFDPRIIGNVILEDGTKKTGIGDFIRKTSLDEFPQFFNVLKGDMSLVGTRPPTIDEWEKYQYHHKCRMATKPGITGLWQVSGRNDITNFEDVVKLDTDYILNFSILNDIKILFKTVVVVLKQSGVK